MINYKSAEEIKILEEGGKRLRSVVLELKKIIGPGIATLEIDNIAGELIRKYGGEPSFKTVPNYFYNTCLPINEQIVHTPPSKRLLKEGDILTLDIGMYYRGFHTDFADTWIIGETKDSQIKKFLEVGKNTLYKAIKKAKAGNYLGEVSKTIEEEIYKNGYFVIKQLTGHGIGRKLHELPYVFGYLNKPIKETLKLKPGLVIAIEVIYSMGTEKMRREKNDNWSIITDDKSLSACFEHTIAILKNKTLILT